MIDIREATKEHHRRAEQQEFVKTLMSGKINQKLYAIYLNNLCLCYGALEKWSQYQGLLDSLPSIKREEKLKNDYQDLWVRVTPRPDIMPSTLEYINHVDSIRREPARLFSHIYVRYMGDLYGGQIIKSKTPGNNTYLDFDNSQQLINTIRQTLNEFIKNDPEVVVEETKTCFDYATELFIELEDLNQQVYRLG